MDWDALYCVVDDCCVVDGYCVVDDFCNAFEATWRSRMIADGERRRKRSSQLSLSEMLTIMIGFHESAYRTFNRYYLERQATHYREFPST